MKPLELTVYPPIPLPMCGGDVLPYRSRVIDESLLRQAKRFTDAELAAEYWRAKHTGLLTEKHGGLSDENREKIRTVERLYLAPHYDEDQP